MRLFRTKPARELEAEELDGEALKALKSDIRREMLSEMSRKPLYPAQAAREFDLSKQRAHYHFKKLREAGLVEETGEEERSGGQATLYSSSADAYYFDAGGEGERGFLPPESADAKEFLEPMLESGEVRGRIVVGSADQHGPDQVRARDGHLASEIAAKLGGYGSFKSSTVALDTEIARDSAYDQNLFILGGVLTNTVAKKFNDAFPARFAGEEFPYREIETPGSRFTEPAIGMIAKAQNPEEGSKSIFIAAGVRNRGTRAATLGFRDLEEIAPRLNLKGYVIVRGLDEDGDGRIDGYEVVE